MPTLPRPRPKRPIDNDEDARRRARAISQIGKAYEAGGAQDDIDSFKPAEDTFNATRDYDILQKLRRKPKINYPLPKG